MGVAGSAVIMLFVECDERFENSHIVQMGASNLLVHNSISFVRPITIVASFHSNHRNTGFCGLVWGSCYGLKT
jgi:hypothetical protein